MTDPPPAPRRPQGGSDRYALAFVERGPLPPHERSWRHPSELAADHRREIRTERPSRSVRAAALTGGTLTILLVGVVVLSVTPRATPNPTVTGSTPVAQRVTTVALGAPGADAIARSVAAALPPRPAPVVAEPPLVTGLGDHGFAVLPSRSVVALLDRSAAGGPASITVVLHDGSTTRASVVDPGDGVGLAVVRITATPGRTDPTTQPSDGFEPASDLPGDGDVVTVLAAEPIDVEMRHLDQIDLTTAELVDGAAVVDADGNLVGLLTDGDDGGRLLVVDESITQSISGSVSGSVSETVGESGTGGSAGSLDPGDRDAGVSDRSDPFAVVVDASTSRD